jgi:glycine cleavage system H protein
MSEIPNDLHYTAEHEWVRRGDGSSTVRIGITDYAQAALGDVVYVQLPEVGASVTAGAACGEIESTKSVSDLYAPVTGTVSAINEALSNQSELVNSDPYGAGWMIEIDVADGVDTSSLIDAAAYAAIAD